MGDRLLTKEQIAQAFTVKDSSLVTSTDRKITQLQDTETARILNEAHQKEIRDIIDWLYEHNALKELDHAKYRVGLSLTYEDWQRLKSTHGDK